MKFCKRFVQRQISTGMAYIDYKMLKKRLGVKRAEHQSDEAWATFLWNEIERVDSCVEETELYLLSILYKLTKGHDPEQRKAVVMKDANFVLQVHHFQLDLALNLIACAKICKKHDKAADRRVILPEMCSVLLKRRLLSLNVHSTLGACCKGAISATSTLEEELIVSYAAMIANKMLYYNSTSLDQPAPPRQLEAVKREAFDLPRESAPANGRPPAKRASMPTGFSEPTPPEADDFTPEKQPPGSMTFEPIRAQPKESPPRGLDSFGNDTSTRLGSPALRRAASAINSLARDGNLSPFKKRQDGALPFALAALQQPNGTADPALIFSMERTFLSSMNQSFYLMLIGSQLMAINDYDSTPIAIGTVIILSGIANIFISYAYHVARLRQLVAKKIIGTYGSNAWLGYLSSTAIIASIIELVYIFVYPQLDRAKSVELAGMDGGSGESIFGR